MRKKPSVLLLIMCVCIAASHCWMIPGRHITDTVYSSLTCCGGAVDSLSWSLCCPHPVIVSVQSSAREYVVLWLCQSNLFSNVFTPSKAALKPPK